MSDQPTGLVAWTTHHVPTHDDDTATEESGAGGVAPGSDADVRCPPARAYRRPLPSLPVSQERSTRQKRALAAVLEASDGFRSAQELFADLQSRGENVGLTTVYNQLRALAESGDVDVLRADDGESLYRRCITDQHHHHLICRHCGRTEEVEGAEVEQWADRVADSHGFVDVRHTLEIFGTCRACATDRGHNVAAGS